VKPGETVTIPLWVSVMCDVTPASDKAMVHAFLYGWDSLGRKRIGPEPRNRVVLKSWMSEEIDPVEITAPPEPGLAILAISLEDATGRVLHRNFTTLLIVGGETPEIERRVVDGHRVALVRIAPKDFSEAKWTLKQWNVLDGLKVNGAGAGFFEYRIPWPKGLDPNDVGGATFVFEASAKRLHGKDREGAAAMAGDYMRGRGTHDPSRNPNAYPMTDTVRFPSAVRVRVGDGAVGLFELPDDPADHRGILSWHAQKRDGRLREAGSYGYLVEAPIPAAAVQESADQKEIVIRLEVDEALPGGLAIYGKRFGRYPLDPMLVFQLKQAVP
jgi:hypothetical protein